jgi:hypothetical protein
MRLIWLLLLIPFAGPLRRWFEFGEELFDAGALLP